jgi:hypothetical protein
MTWPAGMSLTDDRNLAVVGGDEAAAFAAGFRPVELDFFGFRAIYTYSNRTKQPTRAIHEIFPTIYRNEGLQSNSKLSKL